MAAPEQPLVVKPDVEVTKRVANITPNKFNKTQPLKRERDELDLSEKSKVSRVVSPTPPEALRKSEVKNSDIKYESVPSSLKQ